jgi:hypothetical protein
MSEDSVSTLTVDDIARYCLECMGRSEDRLDSRGHTLPACNPAATAENCPNERSCALWPWRMGSLSRPPKRE